MTRFYLRGSLISILLIANFQLQAEGFGIDATRLIYPEKLGSINVQIRNTQPQTPYLVQVKTSRQQAEQISAPFVVTPPLFRLEPQSVNQVRIAFSGASLPADRESVFYFHATAIPAGITTDTSGKDTSVYGGASFGIGNIIKLFYRPSGLQGSSAAAQKGLQFSRVSDGLKISNPSSYYVSLAGLKAGGQQLALDKPEALMLPPYGSHTWSVKTALPAGSQVAWQTINDTGGIDVFSTKVP